MVGHASSRFVRCRASKHNYRRRWNEGSQKSNDVCKCVYLAVENKHYTSFLAWLFYRKLLPCNIIKLFLWNRGGTHCHLVSLNSSHKAWATLLGPYVLPDPEQRFFLTSWFILGMNHAHNSGRKSTKNRKMKCLSYKNYMWQREEVFL